MQNPNQMISKTHDFPDEVALSLAIQNGRGCDPRERVEETLHLRVCIRSEINDLSTELDRKRDHRHVLANKSGIDHSG